MPVGDSSPPTARPWQVLGKKVIYSSPWLSLELWDLRLPDGSRIPEHHVVTFPQPAVGVIPLGEDGRVLLADHYRFQTDSRGWEVPAGAVVVDETVEAAARRELLEEVGSTAEAVEIVSRYHPSNGSSNQVFYLALARGVRQVTDDVDRNETLGLRWFALSEVRELLAAGEILDGLSYTGLLWLLAGGRAVPGG